MKIMLLLPIVLGGSINVSRADILPGIDAYVNNANIIELVRAQSGGLAISFPAPPGKRRVRVEQVLKRVDTTQEFLVSEEALKPDEQGVVLFQYEPSLDTPGIATRAIATPNILVWPMESSGVVDPRGVRAPVAYVKNGQQAVFRINFELIKTNIAAGTPEEIGLNAQVLDAVLFPEKFDGLMRRDVQRAT